MKWISLEKVLEGAKKFFLDFNASCDQTEWLHRDQFFVSRIIFTLLPISMRDQFFNSRIIFTLLPISMRDQFSVSRLIFTLLPISMRDQFFVSRLIFTLLPISMRDQFFNSLRLLYCDLYERNQLPERFLDFLRTKNTVMMGRGVPGCLKASVLIFYL